MERPVHTVPALSCEGFVMATVPSALPRKFITHWALVNSSVPSVCSQSVGSGCRLFWLCSGIPTQASLLRHLRSGIPALQTHLDWDAMSGVIIDV